MNSPRESHIFVSTLEISAAVQAGAVFPVVRMRFRSVGVDRSESQDLEMSTTGIQAAITGAGSATLSNL